MHAWRQFYTKGIVATNGHPPPATGFPLRGLRDGPPPCPPRALRARPRRRCYLSPVLVVPANHSPMISTRAGGSNLGNWTKAQSAAARRPEPAARAA